MAMTTRDSKQIMVMAQLEEALEGVNIEIERCRAGKPSLDSEMRLRFIASKLLEMIGVLDSSECSIPGYEIPGLWRIVTDTWPHTDPLRKIIVEAELHFEKLMKEKAKAHKKTDKDPSVLF